MNVKRFLLLAVVFVIAASVTGCKLPASTAPAATPTTGTGFPVPGTETMGLFETIATQTAAAAAGQPAVQNSAQPTKPTATKKPGAQPQKTKAPSAPTKTPAPPKPTKKPGVVRAATEGIPDTYTLEKGEFPFCIARRFNVNPGELLNRNGLTLNSMTYAGMKLVLPQTGNNFPDGRELHSHPTDYTVRSGDSIYSIACYYGDVDPLVIAQVNGLDEPYDISAGQVLKIP